jgi:hypothetical protein
MKDAANSPHADSALKTSALELILLVSGTTMKQDAIALAPLLQLEYRSLPAVSIQ